MPCAVVVPVEAVHTVEFLAVVLVPLRVLACGEVGHDAAVGVVLRLLLHHPRLGEHHAAAAKVVFQMEMVVRCAVGEGDVAAIDEQPRQLSVLEEQVAAVVGGDDSYCLLVRMLVVFFHLLICIGLSVIHISLAHYLGVPSSPFGCKFTKSIWNGQGKRNVFHIYGGFY